MIVTYSKIFGVAKRNVTVNPAPVSTVITVQHNDQRSQTRGTYSQQTHESPGNGKVSKYIAAVIGSYVFTWLIFFVSAITRTANPAIANDERYYIIASLALNIALSNSALNVFIYACFLSEFREAYKKILCCIFRHQM